MSERRDLDRIPVEIFLNEYVDDRLSRGVTTNLSSTGLYLHRVMRRGPQRLGRDTRFVQLEFALPGTSDMIWARGEVRHDEIDLPLGPDETIVHGTGIRLVTLARGHARLIDDFVEEQRRQRVTEVLALMRRHRYH